MKKTHTCPKCDSKRVGHLAEVQDLAEATRLLSGPQARQIAIASETTKGWLGTSEKKSLAGDVEAYLCADCGYFEEYLKSPETVPWDRLEHFRWCNA